MSAMQVLAINLFVNWIPLAVVFCAFFRYPNGLFIATFAIVIIGFFAVSSFNENIGRMVLGFRPATIDERQKIISGWERVLENIGELLDNETKERFKTVELFVSDEKMPNAFALGKNTICVTKGLLNIASSDSMAGIMAHEAGHLHFGDSQRLAVAVTANQIGYIGFNAISIFIRVLQVISDILSDVGNSLARSGGLLLTMMGVMWSISAKIIHLALSVFAYVSQSLAQMSLCAIGREEEFRADLFAKNLGFGEPLAKFLRKIEPLDTAPQNIWEVLYRTHPPTAERIERLEN